MTAVEWLLEHLERNIMWTDKAEKIAEQAKEMEKQQIIEAHLDGQCFSITIEEFDYAEQYYNETFNK
jgi:hypothetical protein